MSETMATLTECMMILSTYPSVSVIVSADIPCPIPGLEGSILMWSKCRTCGCVTPTTLLSEESSRFSFAKYLELTFYHSYVKPRASLCNHSLYKEYTRFFSLNGMTVRFDYDGIVLVEVRVPPLKLHLVANSALKLQYIETLRGEINAFYDRYVVPFGFYDLVSWRE
jgi:1-phosphatidylinositol-3-phosphate 5-kinase